MAKTYAAEIRAAARGARGEMDGLIENLNEAEINAAIIEIMRPPMTLRKHFAGMIFQQFLSGATLPPGFDASEQLAFAAVRACEAADALLAELAKEPQS